MTITAPTDRAHELLRGLPVFSPVAIKLMALLGDEKVAFKEVAKLFSLDPVLAGKVLQLANSGLYGRRYAIQSVLHATAMLGLKNITAIALTAALSKELPRDSSPWIRGWWRHSIASALIGDHVALRELDLDFGYTAGLLHSLGALALYLSDPQEYPRLMEAARAEDADLLQYEHDRFGVDHAELSGLALTEWDLPPALRMAVAEYCIPNPSDPLTMSVQAGCAYASSVGFGLCGCCPVQADDITGRPLDKHLLTVLATEVNLIECSLV